MVFGSYSKKLTLCARPSAEVCRSCLAAGFVVTMRLCIVEAEKSLSLGDCWVLMKGLGLALVKVPIVELLALFDATALWL